MLSILQDLYFFFQIRMYLTYLHTYLKKKIKSLCYRQDQCFQKYRKMPFFKGNSLRIQNIMIFFYIILWQVHRCIIAYVTYICYVTCKINLFSVNGTSILNRKEKLTYLYMMNQLMSSSAYSSCTRFHRLLKIFYLATGCFHWHTILY